MAANIIRKMKTTDEIINFLHANKRRVDCYNALLRNGGREISSKGAEYESDNGRKETYFYLGY